MRRLFAAAAAVVTLAGAIAAPVAANAQYYHRADDHDDAIAAGIAGLIIGGALGASSRGYGDRYDPYYGRGYYGYGRGYYGGGYYDRGYYGRGYYGRGYDRPYYAPRYGYDRPYRYRQRCRTITRWHPYYGQIRERRCW